MSEWQHIEGASVIINVAKCVEYLRAVGVEVSDAEAERWRDSEKVHRFLRNQRRPVQFGQDMECRNGHWWFALLDSRKRKGEKEKGLCPECGLPAGFMRWRYTVSRDGTVRDYRPKDARWMALDGPPVRDYHFPNSDP